MKPASALLVAVLCAVPRAVAADYYPPVSFNTASGTDMPQAGALMRAGPCVLGGAIAYSAFASAYLMVFDSTSAPAVGATPVWQSASCTAGNICFANTVPAGGIRLSSGAYLVFSSSGVNYAAVAGTSSGFYTVAVTP